MYFWINLWSSVTCNIPKDLFINLTILYVVRRGLRNLIVAVICGLFHFYGWIKAGSNWNHTYFRTTSYMWQVIASTSAGKLYGELEIYRKWRVHFLKISCKTGEEWNFMFFYCQFGHNESNVNYQALFFAKKCCLVVFWIWSWILIIRAH